MEVRSIGIVIYINKLSAIIIIEVSGIGSVI